MKQNISIHSCWIWSTWSWQIVTPQRWTFLNEVREKGCWEVSRAWEVKGRRWSRVEVSWHNGETGSHHCHAALGTLNHANWSSLYTMLMLWKISIATETGSVFKCRVLMLPTLCSEKPEEVQKSLRQIWQSKLSKKRPKDLAKYDKRPQERIWRLAVGEENIANSAQCHS